MNGEDDAGFSKSPIIHTPQLSDFVLTCPLQVFRTRIMPSAVHSRNLLTFQPWRGPKQNRYRSSGQELKSVQNDERIAAMLHGKKRNGGVEEASKGDPPAHAASNPTIQHSVATSHHTAQTSTQSNQRGNRTQKNFQREQPSVPSRKRKAVASLSQRPARRQRGNAPELKDEAYIRSTMRMPTPQEYPDAPKDVFKNPKASIYNVAGQGIAECRSEFIALAQGAYQCTAYYNSAMQNQAVVGEGRTKASCPFHEMGQY